MALIPKADPLMDALNVNTQTNTPRPYLGLSQIGSECHRYLQYYHYWCFETQISARIQRLFNFGHRAEPVMIAALKEQGIEVTGCQDSIIGFGGHWGGHVDGRIGDKRLFEAKTHNDKSFKDLVKQGVEKSKPGHYGQVTSYMGYLELEDCLYMAENKNDSTYYIEVIPFDKEAFEDNKRKEAEVIMSETLLPKIGTGTPTWFKCKMCDAKEVCHKGLAPTRTCRSCDYVDVLMGGEWVCSKSGDHLSFDEQRLGCDGYQLGGMFQ